MKSVCHEFRRGMTLVELLVVVAIIGLLAVTVLPSLSDSTESRRGREAARVLTSFIAKAQSRALGRREWSGFMLVPVSATSFAAIDLVPADVPPVYRGDTVPALLTVIQPASGVSGTATGPPALLASSTGSGLGLQRNDLIRFGGRDPWYELSAPATTGTSLTFRIRGALTGAPATAANSESAGQKAHNTPWPAEGAPLPFEVLRQPAAGGTPLSLPEARVIDLYWSGYGPPLASGTNYARFDVTSSGTTPSQGATTSILFDGTGRVRQIQVRNATATRRLAVTGAIFLLLGRPDRVIANPYDPNDGNQPGNLNPADDSTGTNWQYPDSYWIAIDPFTGVAKSAQCMATGTTVIESQRWIREALMTGAD